MSKEVYEPAEDSFLIIDNLHVRSGEKVLDMGSGCGILAILAAKRASKVVAVDINPHAIANIKTNAKLNRVSSKVNARLGNLFNVVRSTERFDLILFNPPYLPIMENEKSDWLEKAWSGGKTGRTIIDQFISQVSQYLTPHGRILLVQSSLSNIERSIKELRRRELKAKIIDERKLAFEKIVLIEAHA